MDSIIVSSMPSFCRISGSYALKSMLGDIIDNNDIDIYINISDDKYKLSSILSYYKSLLTMGFSMNMNYTHTNELLLFAEKVSAFVAKYSVNTLMDMEEAINTDGYVQDSDFSVIKLFRQEDNMSLDLILITDPVEDYIEEHFDLSICKNYIDNNGACVSMFSDHVNERISEYKMSLLLKRINSTSHVKKFVERIYKYANRNIKIYLTREFEDECYTCSAGDIKCDIHSVLLSKDNMDKLLFNMLSNLMLYCKDNLIQLQLGNLNVSGGVAVIGDIHIFPVDFMLPSVRDFKVFSDMLLAGINKMFMLNELTRELSHPKYFDISILE